MRVSCGSRLRRVGIKRVLSKSKPVVPVVADGKVDKEGIGLFLKRLRICFVFQKRSVGFRTIG